MQEHIIAKKYAKALASICSAEDVMLVYDIYATISQAFNMSKFRSIVNSRVITNEKKLAFFLEIPLLLHLLSIDLQFFLLFYPQFLIQKLVPLF